jgi:hypothetical protein
MFRICLKSNNTITNDPCAICGARCDPDGLDFFIEGTQSLICNRCACRCDHKLAALKAAGAAAVTERENVADFAGWCSGSCHGDWSDECQDAYMRVFRDDAVFAEWKRRQQKFEHNRAKQSCLGGEIRGDIPFDDPQPF